MSFTPAVPLGGLAGLRFLERTDAAQRAAHADAPRIRRDLAYFADNIGSVRSAEALMADRRLATVALGAYGLGSEVGKRAFVARILEGGTSDPASLANRLANEGFRRITADFRFDREGFPLTGSPDLRDKVIAGYLAQTYEEAVGEQDPALRLALDFKRRAGDVASRGWFAILGDRPTREVLGRALGLPDAVASLDIDKQREMFEARAQRTFGTADPVALTEAASADRIVARYLLLDAAASGPDASTPGFAVLSILSSGFGPAASASLLASG